MGACRLAGVVVLGLSMCGCTGLLPVPDYVSVKTPPSYRVDADGAWIDNEDYRLDAEGYRVDKNGERIGDVDVDAKTGNDPSNAMAGYYISSTGTKAPGRVAQPIEGPPIGPTSVNPVPTGMTPLPPIR